MPTQTKLERMWAALGLSFYTLGVLKLSLLILCAAYRFLYDGNRIAEDDTPASLDMEDGGMFNPFYRVEW